RRRALRRRGLPRQSPAVRPDDRRRPALAQNGPGAAAHLRPDARTEVGDLDGRLRVDRRRLRQLRACAGCRSDRAGRRLRPRLPAAARIAHLRDRPAAAKNRSAEARVMDASALIAVLQDAVPGAQFEAAPSIDLQTTMYVSAD